MRSCDDIIFVTRSDTLQQDRTMERKFKCTEQMNKIETKLTFIEYVT